MTKGWRKQPARHSLAARGVKTRGNSKALKKKFTRADLDPAYRKSSVSFHGLTEGLMMDLIDLSMYPKEFSGVISNDGKRIIAVSDFSEGEAMLFGVPGTGFHTHPSTKQSREKEPEGWSPIDLMNIARNPESKSVLAQNGKIYVIEKTSRGPNDDMEALNTWRKGAVKKTTLGEAEFAYFAFSFIGPKDDVQKLQKIMSANIMKAYEAAWGWKAYEYEVYDSKELMNETSLPSDYTMLDLMYDHIKHPKFGFDDTRRMGKNVKETLKRNGIDWSGRGLDD